MSRTTAAVAASDSPVRSRRLRVSAGVGGIVAFVFWLLQPLLVFVFTGGDDSGSRYDLYQASPYLGAYEAVTFGGVAAGLLTFTTAVSLLYPPDSRAGLPWRVQTTLGATAGVAWLAMAGIALSMFTSVGYWLFEEVPGEPEQAAVYSAMDLMTTASGLVYAFAMIGWLTILSTAGRRAGVIGWPTAILALLAAVAACAPLAAPFAPPFGMLAPLLFVLVFGIVLLATTRRA